MNFTRNPNGPNYEGEFKGPNGEFFSFNDGKNKTETDELIEALGGMMGVEAKEVETALVYNIGGALMDVKFTIKDGDLRDELMKAKTFDEAVDIFFKNNSPFNGWSDINTPEEYFLTK